MTKLLKSLLPTRTEAQDHLTRKVTAFPTFAALLVACRGGYCPTFGTSKDARRLANEVESYGHRTFRLEK
jgi:hypothetical protein